MSRKKKRSRPLKDPLQLLLEEALAQPKAPAIRPSPWIKGQTVKLIQTTDGCCVELGAYQELVHKTLQARRLVQILENPPAMCDRVEFMNGSWHESRSVQRPDSDRDRAEIKARFEELISIVKEKA